MLVSKSVLQARFLLAPILPSFLLISMSFSVFGQGTPGQLRYPTNLDTSVSLIEIADRASTTLNGAITSGATTITVVSTSLFTTTGILAIDDEKLYFTAKTSTTFTVVRGQFGSTAAAHSSGASVRMNIQSIHHSVVRDAVIQLETKLGYSSSVPTTVGHVLTVTAAGQTAWQAAGTGTVTNFSAGDLSPIFTTSEATTTTTPALTFNLSTQSANAVFAGPTSGGAAAPTFRALVAADIPSLGATYLPLAGGALTGAVTSTSYLQAAIYDKGGEVFNVLAYGAVADEYGLFEDNTITATNGSATVTSAAKFPARLVGLGTFTIYLQSVAYTVSTVASTSSLTLTANYTGTTSSSVSTAIYIQASVTGSNTTITCALCKFVQATDAGKKVVFSGVNGAAAHSTTISSVTNTTTAVVAVAPPTTGTVDIWFGTDNTTAFQSAMTAADAVRGSVVYIPQGDYLMSYLTMAKNTTVRGAGKTSTRLYSYISSGGIIRGIWPSNGSTRVFTNVEQLYLRAIDTNSVQYGIHDNGGSYGLIDEVAIKDAHIGVVLDQSELWRVRNSLFENYGVNYYGVHNGSLDPASTIGWTKTGTGTTSTDSGYWTINTTGSNATTYYSRATGATLFYKGLVAQGNRLTLTAKDNITDDNASVIRFDNGATQRHEVRLRKDGSTFYIYLNGNASPTTFNASSTWRIEVAVGGATADLYVDGTLVEDNVAAMTTSGDAIVGFGDFATTDDANVGYGNFYYVSAFPVPVGLWLVNGAEVTAGNNTGYTNVIHADNNDFNGLFFHIWDSGGTDHSFNQSNHNAGLHAIHIASPTTVEVSNAAFEGHAFEAIVVDAYAATASTPSGKASGVKVRNSTINNSSATKLAPVRLEAAYSVDLDTLTFTKGAAAGYLVEVAVDGVDKLASHAVSSGNVPDSYFSTPARSITADQNNYTTGPHNIVFLSTDASRTMTGATGGYDRRQVTFINAGSNNLVLANESASSTAANRFTNSSGADITLAAKDSVTMVYDSASLRWRVKADATGGGASLPVADTTSIVEGSADATKEIRFEVDGLTTGTVRVLTPPNADIVIAGSAAALISGRLPSVTTGGLLVDSANATLDTSGNMYVVKGSIGNSGLTTAQLNVTPGSSSTIGQIIKAAASQSVDLLSIQNSSGTVLTKINKDGSLFFGEFPAVAGSALASYPSIGYNAVPNPGSANAWTYGITDTANLIHLGRNNAIEFYLASSGTAGNAISFTRSFSVAATVTTWDDAINLAFGSSTGSKIGTATSQKIGFFNATPIAQPATTGTTIGFTANTSANTLFNESTFTGNVGSTAYTISDLVKMLKNLGLIAQ